jgi:GTPase SAR1 family protein
MKKIGTLKNHNIIFLGDWGVGKTSLANALSGRQSNKLHPVTNEIINFTIRENPEITLVDFEGERTREEIIEQINTCNPAIAILVTGDYMQGFESGIDKWNSIINECFNHETINKFLVVTRYENENLFPENEIDFSEYGFKNVFKASSLTGHGIQELRSAILDAIPKSNDDEEAHDVVSIAIRNMVEKLCEAVAKDPNCLCKIEWRELERIIAHALDGLGFAVELTPPSKDGGKDVIAYCTLENEQKKYYVEIKHWSKDSRPGDNQVSEFVQVNARDNTDGGLFLSSSGFTDSVKARIGELMNQKVRLGEKNKIYSLCKQYVLKRDGLWYPQTPLPVLLFEQTLI